MPPASPSASHSSILAALAPVAALVPPAILMLSPHTSATTSAASVPPGGPEMRVHLIDVGQGAATLVEFPCGAMLVDTGGEQNAPANVDSSKMLGDYLRAFFDRRTDLDDTIDLLVLTHPHVDHVRGVPTLLESFTVRNLVDDGRPGLVPEAAAAVAAARAYVKARPESRYLAVRTDRFAASGKPMGGSTIDPFKSCKGANPAVTALWGGLKTDPGWGLDRYGERIFDNDNNHSVVTRVDFGESSLLVTGDLEEDGIRDMLAARTPGAADVDILQVGHHGSYNATTPALLSAVTPQVALVSMGPASRKGDWTAWQFGHPRKSTIELLATSVSGRRTAIDARLGTAQRRFVTERIDEAIFATGWDGTVVLRADLAGRIEVGEPDGQAEEAKPPATVESLVAAAPLTTMTVTFSDVEEGDGIHLQLGDTDILLDAGRSTNPARYLSGVLGALRGPLEFLVLSHPHIDHYGGLASVLSKVKKVERVVTNGERRGKPRDPDVVKSWATMEDVVTKAGLTLEAAVAGKDLVNRDGLRVHVLWAGGNFADTSQGEDINNDSVVMMVEYGGRKILFTGDIEEEAGAGLVDRYCTNGPDDCPALDADVLKVPHHGSAHFDPGFLRAVNPEWAVVSADYKREDSHRLPRIAVHDALRALGAAVYSTSADGPDPVVLAVGAGGEVAWKVPASPAFFWDYVDGAWDGVEVAQGGW